MPKQEASAEDEYFAREDIEKQHKLAHELAAQQAKIEHKFRHLAVPAIGEGASEQVIAILRDLERQPDVRSLMSICAGGRA